MINKDTLFWFFALSGSGLFIIQFLMTLLGSDDSDHFDEGNFKWLSKQAFTGFLMLFGWSGLTCSKEFALSGLASSAIAFVIGGFSIFVTGFLFKMARKLRSTGTVFNIEDAIGKEAVIYQQIPKGGAGKVTVSLHHLTHELDAISPHEEDLPSFTHVQIIKKRDDKTVIVIPLK